MCVVCVFLFFFQAEDGIRDLVRSRGLGDVYKRQPFSRMLVDGILELAQNLAVALRQSQQPAAKTKYDYLVYDAVLSACLLYTSDAAAERSSVDLGGRRIIKKKTHEDRGHRDS